MANTRRMNRLEELGRVDAEKGFTRKGKRNLRDEKKRIVRELKASGGSVKKQGYKAREDESLGMRTGKESGKINKRGGGLAKRGMGQAMKKGGHVKSMGKATRGGGVAVR